MDLHAYARILRKSWGLIVLLTLVGVASAAAWSLTQTAVYTATAKVFVSTQSSGSTSELAQGSTFAVQRVKTYVDLVGTPLVLGPVVESGKLRTTPDQLAKRVTAAAPPDTSIIAITVVDTDPERAAATADATAASLTAVVQGVETPKTEGAVSPVSLTIAQQAIVPTMPVSPKIPLNIALGGLVALTLGLGLAALREISDTRIRSQRDVALVTDAAILGGIALDPKASERPLIVHVDPRSPRAESFRTLRTNLQYLDIGRPDRAFVITSSIEAEGKSTTGANLAIALADTGSRVLLIDADLRQPKIADYMGLDGTMGLTDLLVGRVQPEDVIQPWGKGTLSVLPAGHIPPNPSELLGSNRMTHLVGEFNKAFDVVIFDSPPLLPVTDAAILAKTVGGAIVVVAAGRTRKAQLTDALAALATVGAPVSGLVLTMLPTKGPDASGYGHYGYGRQYGQEAPVKAAPSHAVAAAPTRAGAVN